MVLVDNQTIFDTPTRHIFSIVQITVVLPVEPVVICVLHRTWAAGTSLGVFLDD